MFVYLLISEAEGKRKIFYPLVHSTNDYNSQSWGKMKPELFMCVSRTQGLEPLPFAFQDAFQQESWIKRRGRALTQAC